MKLSKPDSSHGWSIIPEGEHECIWMNAGVLPFQLCDHAFACESCPIDANLRIAPALHEQAIEPTHEIIHVGSVELELTRKAAAMYYDALQTSPEESDRCNVEVPRRRTTEERVIHDLLRPYTEFSFRTALKYSKHHLWIDTKEENVFRVGIDDFFATLLTQRYRVILPSQGSKMKIGDAVAWIQMNGSLMKIPSPLAGEVSSRNGQLIASQHLLHDSPYEDGWLVEIRTDNGHSPVEKLIPSVFMRLRFLYDAKKLHQHLLAALKKNPEPIGASMLDGGMPVRSIEEGLGVHAYVKIVKAVLGVE